MMEGTPLPADIIARFANKTMNVVGYECNQVQRTADGDIPLPINAACKTRSPPSADTRTF